MSALLLGMLYFFRPIISIDFGWTINGVNSFELFTVIIFCVLITLLVISFIKNKEFALSSVDIAILLYVFWCTVSLPFGLGNLDLKTYIKWVAPPLTYIIVSKSIYSLNRYIICLKILVYGSSIPIIGSAIAIKLGYGMENVNFWTGIPRYAGLFNGSHTLGHSVGFLIMAIISYLYMDRKINNNEFGVRLKIFVGISLFSAMYCLIMSHVRTVMIGLVIYSIYTLFIYNKKKLIVFTVSMGCLVISFSPLLNLVFHDVIEATSGKASIENAGSGRPFIWRHNLEIFRNLPLEQQFIGVGVGNVVVNEGERMVYGNEIISTSNVWNSHNDFMESMMQTGIIGLFLQLSIFLFIFLKLIRSLPLFKHLYIGSFIAIMFMDFVSNSYISRFGMAQLFYMYFAYAEVSFRNNEALRT